MFEIIYTKEEVFNIETLYKIVCNVNNKFYIGSTSDFDVRLSEHIGNCKNEKYKVHYKRCPKLYDDIINLGFENFTYIKLYESEDKIEISRKESKLIRENIGNELMYNNVLGASGRRVLSDEDVCFIRDLYASKTIYIKEAYDIYYKDIITYRAFKKCWHGDTFPDIHYDVYTKENKEWHFSKGQSRPGEKNRASKYTEEEVISIRKRRDSGESKADVWKDYKGRSHRNSFYAIWYDRNWKHLLENN